MRIWKDCGRKGLQQNEGIVPGFSWVDPENSRHLSQDGWCLAVI